MQLKNVPFDLMLSRTMLLGVINGIFAIYVMLHSWGREGFLQSLCINLIIFVIPAAVVWLFCAKQNRDFLDIVIVSLGAAVFFIISYVVLHLLLQWPVTNYSFLLWIAITTNLVLLFAKNEKFTLLRMPPQLMLVIFIVFFVVYVCSYWAGTYRITYLFDCDIERSGTSYGLMHHGKPYILTDRDSSYFYAHPLLMNLYSASTLLLSGHIEDMKFYYDKAIERLDILSQNYKEGDRVHFFGHAQGGQNFIIKSIAGETIVFTENSPFQIALINAVNSEKVIPLTDRKISRKTLNYLRVENSLNDMERTYMDRPNFLSGRMSLYFLFALTCVAMFLLLFRLCGSYLWGLIGVLVYATVPEIFILSSAGIFTTIINLSLVVLLYYYLFQGASGQRLFFAGLLCAVSSQKTIILPISIILWEIIRGEKSRPKLKSALLHQSVVGFAAGLGIYWLYGLLTNPGTFINEHIKYHFLNRIFHINDLGYTYPFAPDVWKGFIANFGPVMFIVSLCALIYKFFTKDLPGRNRNGIQFIWFLIGAIVYSSVDWRTHYHLLLIVPPLIIGSIEFFSERSKQMQFAMILLCVGAIVINAIKLWGLLSADFYAIYKFMDL